MTQKKNLLILTLYFIFLSIHNTQADNEKLHIPGLNNRKSITLNKCSRCKVLTDSFSYWLKKTSRGKYEGGDAAWEESKLKSYARSEVRLVEIQEGLCSELTKHKDYCYNLAEETDQVLEKWWFYEDPESVDLYTWLCIETLKHCCPANHFGGACTPCPMANSKTCSGNGKCDGDGTREGTGECVCKKGYSGNSCENCGENFFSSGDGACEQCHQACSGCSGEGPSACNSCKPGWQLNMGACVDVDECLLENSCKKNEICVNREGSFKCNLCDKSCETCSGMGPKNCTSCEPPSVLWGSICVTKKQQVDIFNTLIRLIMYIGITIVTAFIFRKYKTVLYLYFAVVAAAIAYFETNHMNTIAVLKLSRNLNFYGLYDAFSNIITELGLLFK